MAVIREDFVGVVHVYVDGDSVFLVAGEEVPEGVEVRGDVLAGDGDDIADEPAPEVEPEPVADIDEDVAIFVPPASADAGVTAWGTTLESLEADYAIVDGERPGIVVAAMKSRNPIGVYAHAAAIGLPVLKNANAFMAATIL